MLNKDKRISYSLLIVVSTHLSHRRRLLDHILNRKYCVFNQLSPFAGIYNAVLAKHGTIRRCISTLDFSEMNFLFLVIFVCRHKCCLHDWPTWLRRQIEEDNSLGEAATKILLLPGNVTFPGVRMNLNSCFYSGMFFFPRYQQCQEEQLKAGELMEW